MGTGDADREVTDSVNPAYYRGDRVMRIIERYGLGFCLGNAVKYILRHEAKGGVDDLRRARWYLNRRFQFSTPGTSAILPSEADISEIAEEFDLGFNLGGAIRRILYRGEGTSLDDLRSAMRLLDRRIRILHWHTPSQFVTD